MEDSLGLMLLLQVVLIALNAIFACAEIAVISFNDNKLSRMAQQGDKRAQRLVRLTDQPARFLATIQVAITLAGFLGSAFAADNFSDTIVQWMVGLGVNIPLKVLDTIAVVIVTLILSYFTLVFGELVPKRLAMRKSEELALAMSSLVDGLSKVFAPIVWLLTASTNAMLRLLRIDPNEEDDEVGEEEIRMMVDEGSERGVIDKQEQEFIHNVFEFDNLTAGELCTHRTALVILWMEDTMEEWAKTIHDSRHTYFPVCGDTADDVRGILNAKDYFRLDDKSRENVLANAVQPAYFVPETVGADVLFRNMKSSRSNLAVVLDEYGGMLGLATMNDLLEELVGELDYEAAPKAVRDIEQIGEDSWRILGSTPLEEVTDTLKIKLPHEDFDTFNGLVLSALTTVPEDGATCDVKVAGLLVNVTRFHDHRVVEAIVRRMTPMPDMPATENAPSRE